ncbi:MAG: hypothetical protein QM756_09630 [Polyangiaceae bacterium]
MTPSIRGERMVPTDPLMYREEVPDPKGDRIVVQMNGKFLPYRRF